MRTLTKMMLVCGLGSLAFAGCKKTDTGDLVVKLTDAPGDYLQVNVDITSVEVHYSGGGGWMTLPTNSGVYDLLTLQNNVTAVLATGTSLPGGDMSQLRLILGPNNTLMLNDSTIHPMTVPSSAESGLKVNVHRAIPGGSALTVTLDFDADKSVHQEGNGSYSMKPVITVESVY